MLLWLEGAKAITVAAASAAELDVDRAEYASIAKAYVSDRGPAIVRDCLQIHGGIGYTWEYDLHLFLRRVDSNAALFGGAAHHEDRLAHLVGL
jgi:alkylation response protein AidB-like acyl-CoA dehydrogenase